LKPQLRVVRAAPLPSRTAVTGATLFVMAATLGSTMLGFFREVVNARYFGTRWEMDAFLAAATIPTILFGIFNGALVSALVPVFSDYLACGEEDDAWRLGNTIVNGLAVVLAICAVVGWVGAPYYVPVIAHGFGSAEMAATIAMTRWLMPSIVAVSLSGVFSAMLNAYHRFRATALMGIAINAVTIGTTVALVHRLGIRALVLGTLLGLIAQAVVQLPTFLSLRRYRPEVHLRHPGLRRMWTLLGPVVVGSAAGQIALFFDRYFASTLAPGYIAGMNYAVKLVNFPQQIFAAAIATVIFPLLASQFAVRNHGGVRHSVVLGLRLVNLITIPSVCGLVVLAKPIVAALFQRGNFGASATDLTAALIPYAAVGLVALAANVVLSRCAFACKEMAWTVAISVFTMFVNVVLSMLWLPSLGARGLLLANSVSQSLQTIFLFALLWHVLGGFDIRTLWVSTVKVAASAAAMVAVLHWIASLGVHPEPTFASRAWYLAGQLGIGALVFVAVGQLVQVEEMPLVWQMILENFARNILAPPENREAPIA
jgi:putative peptidoglycan lipid II flippase